MSERDDERVRRRELEVALGRAEEAMLDEQGHANAYAARADALEHAYHAREQDIRVAYAERDANEAMLQVRGRRSRADHARVREPATHERHTDQSILLQDALEYVESLRGYCESLEHEQQRMAGAARAAIEAAQIEARSARRPPTACGAFGMTHARTAIEHAVNEARSPLHHQPKLLHHVLTRHFRDEARLDCRSISCTNDSPAQALKLDSPDRRKKINALRLKWHPDKHEARASATAAVIVLARVIYMCIASRCSATWRLRSPK